MKKLCGKCEKKKLWMILYNEKKLVKIRKNIKNSLKFVKNYRKLKIYTRYANKSWKIVVNEPKKIEKQIVRNIWKNVKFCRKLEKNCGKSWKMMKN